MSTFVVGSKDTTTAAAGRRGAGHWIDDYDPEDPDFWEASGRRIARRNLGWSMLAEHLGFSVWLLWSIVAVHLNDAGFGYSADQLFWLVSVPSLVGATLRLPYTFAVPRFGGRNWTVVSALLLVVPAAGLAWAVSDPQTPFWAMLVVAATAGFGGGNFASSMANISYFFPEKEKGWALGLNAAGGNIGVAVVQAPVVVSALIVAGGGLHLGRAGLMWIPLAVLAAVAAWRYMDNLSTAKSDFASSAAAARRGHTWIMSFLYIGTFGSFIGYSAAFPLLIKTQFPHVGVVSFAFLGALVGSVSRPLGGWLADRLGGARITAVSFVVMGIGVSVGVWAMSGDSFGLFLASFMLLFVASGIGNGSTYRMIPSIFHARAVSEGLSAETIGRARREAAAAIGLIAAVGAYGGFLVPRTYAWAISGFGSIVPALYAYLGLYAVMLAVTWLCYLRPAARRTTVGV
jgi:MFS transporter, NNP family, nitrate/nitrite transporter